MGDDDGESKDGPRRREISQIPLLQEIVFDSSLPLKPPPRPRRASPKPPPGDHGPHYDPETLDLFEDREPDVPPSLESHQRTELRAGASKMIDELVEEYSAEISRRLRVELTDQLGSILKDLSDTTEGDMEDEGDADKPGV